VAYSRFLRDLTYVSPVTQLGVYAVLGEVY
jgi:hypothetical protein